jgi:hypothetical protein
VLRVLLLYATSDENATIAYQYAWPRSFLAHPRLDCSAVNMRSRTGELRLRGLLAARSARFDAVVILHSVFSNECLLGRAMRQRLARLREPKAYFIGNEYKLMPQKMTFCEELGIALLVSQLPPGEAHRLYRERLGCEVAYIPSAGLDVELFRARTRRAQRPIDVGYRAYDAPMYLGNLERRQLAERFIGAAPRHGLTVDISLDPGARLAEREWAGFLDRCKGQLGSEAGGDYFELTDGTRLRVNAYLDAHPEARFDEIFERFFRDYQAPVSGRALSGRVVEAAGTKTVQILIEGGYGGFFRPGVHYIPLRKDLGNLDDAMEMFLDEGRAAEIADAAYEVAQTQLTYTRLIDRFIDALEEVLSR